VNAPSPVGLLVMAYGTAKRPEDIERYYTDIRGGRPPSPQHLRELKGRYAAIGNRFPLLEITRRQAEGLAAALEEVEGTAFRAYLGMKHSPPSIPDGVARMRESRIERAVGIVMAPHWSAMSVETYVERVERAVASEGGPAFTFVRHWHDHPEFVSFLAGRVGAALDRLTEEERDGAAVLFSAHSLPVRTEDDGTQRCLRCVACLDSCTYRRQLERTAELVAGELGLRNTAIAWQSAGRTADPWWQPTVEEVIQRLASAGTPAVVVCPAGFVADHLEILYDLDIEVRDVAEEAGIRFERTEMPNADPAFVGALAAVVRDHVAAPAA
jgi:ferrochelatase